MSDAGLDDVMVSTSVPASVPEPGRLTLIDLAPGGMAVALRRKRVTA